MKDFSTYFKDLYQDLKDNNDKSNLTFTSIPYVNRCFIDDLIVEFPLREEQVGHYDLTIAALLNLKENYSQIKVPINEFYNNEQFAKKILVVMGDLLTEFQKDQIMKSPGSIIVNTPQKLFLPTTSKGFIQSLIAHNQTKVMVQNIPISSRLGLENSIHQLMAYDRIGDSFKIFRQFLNQNINVNYHRYSTSSFYTNRDPNHISLARYKNNNDIEIILTLNPFNHVETDYHIYGEEETIKKLYKTPNRIEANKKFKELFKEFTNREYEPGIFFEPSDQYYGYFILTSHKKYRIPPFKRICFSVLFEIFLIDRNEFKEKFIQLPFDIQKELICECSTLKKPVGFEIIQYLMELLAKGDYISDQLYREMFSFEIVIQSMILHHEWYYNSEIYKIPQNLFAPPYSENILINVYKSLHLFNDSNLPIPKDNLLFTQMISPNPLILQSSDRFFEDFNSNTTDFFTKIPSWSNMVVIGGIMTTSLSGETTGFEYSDIDVCFYGITPHEMMNKLSTMVETLDPDSYSLMNTCNEFIIVRHYPHRNIQVNLQVFNSIQDILMGVDIDASCFAFDGKTVWTTQRGVQAFNYRSNFASATSYRIRGDDLYQRRLIKYLDRGFNISYIPTNHMIEQLNNNNNYKKKNKTTVYDESNIVGIGVLFKARNDPVYLNRLQQKNLEGSIPNGPDINKNNFEEMINELCSYDGYGNSDGPKLLNNFHDLYNDYSPDYPLANVNIVIEKPWYHLLNVIEKF